MKLRPSTALLLPLLALAVSPAWAGSLVPTGGIDGGTLEVAVGAELPADLLDRGAGLAVGLAAGLGSGVGVGAWYAAGSHALGGGNAYGGRVLLGTGSLVRLTLGAGLLQAGGSWGGEAVAALGKRFRPLALQVGGWGAWRFSGDAAAALLLQLGVPLGGKVALEVEGRFPITGTVAALGLGISVRL